MKKICLLIASLSMMVQGAWAWIGSGTDSDPYLIRNAADWATLVETVNNGQTDLSVKLDGDITISQCVGTPDRPFRGTFDGCGHTITANLVGTTAVTAPFAYVKNATIAHLKVTGTITGGKHSAGVVGVAENIGGSGCNYITDCRVSATIQGNPVSGQFVVGGILGHGKSSRTDIRGCLFDGKITATGRVDFSYAGAIVGWCDSPANIYVSECIEGTKGETLEAYNGGIRHAGMTYTISGSGGSATAISLTNCYTLARDWGEVKRAYRIVNLSDDLRLAYYTDMSHPTTGIEAIPGGGLVLNGTCYAAKGETVGFDAYYPLDRYTGILNIDEDDSGYSITMPASDVYISLSHPWKGNGTEESPYLVESSADWQQLAHEVKGGTTHSGHFFRLTSDIDIHTSVGKDNAFAGTFDGDGHTLTYNAGELYTLVTTRLTAPFQTVSGATIRHLRTTGDIYTEAKFAAGIVAKVSPPAATRLFDCSSDMRIHSFVNGDGTHGGLVAVVDNGAGRLTIDKCTFTGNLYNRGNTTKCGGLVGWSYVPVTIKNSVFNPQGWTYLNSVRDGATLARMDTGATLTIEDSYATMNMNTRQGTFIMNEMNVPDGVTYEFLGEPDVTIDGQGYYKNGCRVKLTVADGTSFHHWYDNNGCFISDPWTAGGIHQLKDLYNKPSFAIITTDIPEAETRRTLWGVTYRYLSRRDYHYFISDEDCAARGWKFENGDSDANLVVYDSNGKASEITAITGYDESDYNSDGVQIHNDLVGDWRAHTHLGMISPHAFQNSKKLETLYFKDTDANNYNTLLPFDFYICEGAFAGCSNFREMKMMQYTTRGSNHWEALSPTQVVSVADDAFTGCDQLRISVHNSKYQSYLSSPTWKTHRRRFIIYEATTEDFTVNGVKYHYYRDAQETNCLKNDESGKSQMMDKIRTWNADYQQFNASNLLETNSDDNVWYVSIIGVDNSDIDKAGGVMRIYNDPGSYYNYKTINLQRDALVGNEHVKSIEFYQTNGNSENSYSNLKMVIPNGAFKGCKNLQELRMFYYVQDGEDHWTALGPKNVIPGDNIFGEPTDDEVMEMSQQQIKSSLVPEGFRILVAPDLYYDFINDPNWQNYLSYIEPVDYSPGAKEDFTEGGLTYGYMASLGGIAQTSQVVSQDVSWWTVPRIGIEVLLWLAQIKSIYTSIQAASAVSAAENTLTVAEGRLQQAASELSAAQLTFDDLTGLSNTLHTAMREGMKNSMIDALDDFTINDYLSLVAKYASKNYAKLLDMGFITKNSVWNATEEIMEDMSAEELTKVCFLLKEGLSKAAFQQGKTLVIAETAKTTAENTVRTATARLAAAKAARTTAILKGLGYLGTQSAATTTSAIISANCWGGSGSYNGDLLQKGMRENILSNIHQVGLVGGGYIITTPQKNLVYHTYIKSVADNVTDAVIYAGFDNDNNVNTSNRTMTFARKAFQNKKNLKSVRFHDISNQSSNTGMPLLLTIPDSAFTGCSALTEFSTLLQTGENGTRALGPENFVLAGDSIFAGLAPATFHIVIDPLRKQDFLDNASWKPLEKYFTYQSAKPAVKYKEYGAQYAYAYEQNSIKKEHKVSGHLIEHTIVTGPDDDFIKDHQGAVKLCNDIGTYNNYQLDEVMAEAFKGNQYLRSVTFTDLYGFGAFGDSYTGLQMHIGDRAFKDCSNLADVALLYMVTDGTNHLDPLTPQQVTIGKEVFDGTTARLKMMPQQVAWFEADTAWAAYKDRFMPCVIRFSDPGIKKALKDMAFYDAANTGSDDAHWTDYCDYARIVGIGFSWLDGRFTAQKDDIYSFADFRWFESVGLGYVGASWFEGCTKLGNIVLPATVTDIRSKAFKDCSALKEIELPQAVTTIDDEAFSGCTSLQAIRVLGNVPAQLGTGTFHKHSGLKIYVPADKVSAYKSAWSEYAQYIVGGEPQYINKVVTVSAVGQLADKLGLTLVKESDKVRYIQGPYGKYDSLTVIGPLNGEDLAVIRHLAGADAYDSDPTDGCLRYLNLWDAQLRKDKANSYNGNYSDEYIVEDNMVPDYLFENCTAIETVILPQSATKIGENIFEEATGLKRIAIGRKTTEYDTDLLQDLNGIDELVLLTEDFATNNSIWNDPWEAPIQQVYALQSQIGNYLGDTKLTRQAQDISSPFAEDAVTWALADKGHFFPSAYLLAERVEGIFNGNTAITAFDDFWQFQGVKALENTFEGNSGLTTITLPTALERIGAAAFSGCTSLQTIHINCDSVPELGADAFASLPADFQILVPKSLCKLYRTKWPQYADHINPEASDGTASEIITVTVTAPNTLAAALGLTATTQSLTGFGGKCVSSLKGDYSKIRRLKVVGPISGGDLDVLRYLAGYCPWANTRNYAGHLEYLDLYDAQIKATDVGVSGYRRSAESFMASEDFWLWKVWEDNVLPHHGFLRAYSLKTLILPKTCTEVEERALQECESLETLVVGDNCTAFNWNALDDDAMLTRMYILANKKMNIGKELAIWRWLCNNYNPTFDAFYVRPSLFDEYLNDDNYTGSSWQRTNNISKGAFDDDESFAVFASHAAATADDLSEVYSVNGWFDSHTGVRNLTPLGYTAIDELRTEDFQKLTKLEKVTLPATLETIEAGVFAKSPNLRYVDMIMSAADLVNSIKARGFADLGINTQQTLVYLPQSYGEAVGTNVIVFNGTGFTAEKFRLVDGKDYCVPYTFKTTKVENTRTLPTVGGLYTVCLPYAVTNIPDGLTAYQLADRSADNLVFRSVTAMEPLKPYLVKVRQPDATLNTETAEPMTIPASDGTYGTQDNTAGYALRGTLTSVDNKTLADQEAYILQADQLWHPVTTNSASAYVPAFRAYLLQYGGSARPVSMTLIDDETTTIRPANGSTQNGGVWYDLQGRRLGGEPTQRGVYIVNGKTVIMK